MTGHRRAWMEGMRMSARGARRRRLIVTGVMGIAAWAMQPTAGAASFTNSSSITIPASGNGSPYPSNILVSGLSGTIQSISVTLNGLSHTFLDDIGILVKGPTGAALLLMDGAADASVSNVTITFHDGFPALDTTTAPTTGTYKPT